MNKKNVSKLIMLSVLSIALIGCGTTQELIRESDPSTKTVYGCKLRCGAEGKRFAKDEVVYNGHVFSDYNFNVIFNGLKGFKRIKSNKQVIASNKVNKKWLEYVVTSMKNNKSSNIIREKEKEITIETKHTDNDKISLRFATFYYKNNVPLYLLTTFGTPGKNIKTSQINYFIVSQGFYYDNMTDYKVALDKMTIQLSNAKSKVNSNFKKYHKKTNKSHKKTQ